jgi:hypothetical protein
MIKMYSGAFKIMIQDCLGRETTTQGDNHKGRETTTWEGDNHKGRETTTWEGRQPHRKGNNHMGRETTTQEGDILLHGKGGNLRRSGTADWR